MKLIIDIPEEMQERINEGYVPLGISKYLKNGTPYEERPQGSCKELLKELKNCRNELCLKCGKYNESYKGACDDCRYNFENMKKWEVENECKNNT